MILLLVAVLFSAAVWQLLRFGDQDSRESAPAGEPPAAVTPATEATITASIYLPARDLSRIDLFSVELPDRRADLQKWVEALFSAFSSPPSNTALPILAANTVPRHVFVDENQTLYLDMPASFAEAPPTGAEMEILTIQSIVRTLTENISGVKAVKILMEGSDRDTLWGHVDVRNPIGPRP
ncbi:MAG TPA: GerMN domain-containing protein [Bdellovibrionota bacterium]|nr:GerMN domain-containing protein [Bdellovibrionota bacterium]